MRIGLTTGKGAALGLALAAVAAGTLGSPWGVAVRADAQALVNGTPPSRTALAPPAAPIHKPGTASAPLGSAADRAQAAVDAVVPQLVAGRPADSVSIVGTDGTSGVTVHWGARTVMPAASVFKLTLLECYLLIGPCRATPP